MSKEEDPLSEREEPGLAGPGESQSGNARGEDVEAREQESEEKPNEYFSGHPEVGASEPYVSDAALALPGGWERLTTWLVARSAFLPIIAMDRSFVRQIDRMDPTPRHQFLETFLGDLLAEPEREEWARLVNRFESAGDELVAFWRQHRGL